MIFAQFQNRGVFYKILILKNCKNFFLKEIKRLSKSIKINIKY